MKHEKLVICPYRIYNRITTFCKSQQGENKKSVQALKRGKCHFREEFEFIVDILRKQMNI